MLANLDGLVYHKDYGEVIFEAKTASQYMAHEWEDDKIPDSYMLQLQHYMAVTDFKGAYIAVLLGGNNFKYQFVERDEELIEMLIELESEFWESVQSNIPPALDGSDASAKFLKEYFPDSAPDTTIALPKSATDLVEQYLVACEDIKKHEERKQEAENLLKQMLGDKEIGIIGGADGDSSGDDRFIITWKSFRQERLDTKAIKADHPTLCQKYSNTNSCRRFSVKLAS